MKTDYNRVAVWTWVRIVPVLVLWPAIGLSQDAKAPQPLGSGFAANHTGRSSSLVSVWLPGRDSNLRPCG